MISQADYIESSSLHQGRGRTKVEPDKTKPQVWGDQVQNRVLKVTQLNRKKTPETHTKTLSSIQVKMISACARKLYKTKEGTTIKH